MPVHRGWKVVLLEDGRNSCMDVTNQDSIKQFQFRVTAGLNVGGLTPIPLPNNIRKVKSYNPRFNPSVGLEGLYQFQKNGAWESIQKLNSKE